MATLSEDGNSWKARGIKRRDFRNTKGEPEIGKPKAKKNRKRWCRGREGKEHIIVHLPHPTYGKYGAHVDRCEKCGKEVKFYWPRHITFAIRNRCPGCP